jgi:uncharacterized protein (DUF1697 family)
MWSNRSVTRFVAFLRAVNLGRRTVPMASARQLLQDLGYGEVASYVNSGNLLFDGKGKPDEHEAPIRQALEGAFGFEVTTFVRSAAQVRELVSARPFGDLEPGHTHFALLTLTPLSRAEKAAAEGMSNDHDTVLALGRDLHWLIRSRSTETTLGPKEWKQSLPSQATTARNLTMLTKLVERL